MKAPDFRLRDQDGNAVSLDQFRGKRVVLFFYPKAETPGCTVEACSFRDNVTAFSRLDAVVLGISPDEPDELKSFEMNHDLNFPLLSDPTHEIAEQYGVWKEKSFMGRRFMGVARTTFLIDEEGNIAKRYDNVNPVSHTAEVLADLGAKPGQPPTRTGQRPTTRKAVRRPVKRAAKARGVARKSARKAVAKKSKRKTAKRTSRSSSRTPARKRGPVKRGGTRAKAAVRGRR